VQRIYNRSKTSNFCERPTIKSLGNLKQKYSRHEVTHHVHVVCLEQFHRKTVNHKIQ